MNSDTLIVPNQPLHKSTLYSRLGIISAPRTGLAFSPQGEGPLLVSAHAVAVDGGGARHSIQVVRAVGQRGYPLATPLPLLLPS